MDNILQAIRRDVADAKIEVDNPSQNLESYFLEVVRKAKENLAETSGATSGSKVAEYLRGEGEAAPVTERVLDRLTVAAPKPQAPSLPAPAGKSKIDSAKLESLAIPRGPFRIRKRSLPCQNPNKQPSRLICRRLTTNCLRCSAGRTNRNPKDRAAHSCHRGVDVEIGFSIPPLLDHGGVAASFGAGIAGAA